MASTSVASLTAMPGDTKHTKGAPSSKPEEGDLFQSLLTLLQEGAGEEKRVDAILNRLGEKETLPQGMDLSRLAEEKKEPPTHLRQKIPFSEISSEKKIPKTAPAEPDTGDLFLPLQEKTSIRSEKTVTRSVSIDTLLQQIARSAPDLSENRAPAAAEPPESRLSDVPIRSESAGVWLAHRSVSLTAGSEREASLRTVADLKNAKDPGTLKNEAQKAGLNPVRFHYEGEVESPRSPSEGTATRKLPEFFTRQEHYLSSATAGLIGATAHEAEAKKDSKLLTVADKKKNFISSMDPKQESPTVASTKETTPSTPLKDLMQKLSNPGQETPSARETTPHSIKKEEKADLRPDPSAAPDRVAEGSVPDSGDPIAPLHGRTENDALQTRIAEAKQTVRHFAQTLQEQVENYKPPFSRMQLSLEPKELGSVEVTMVSRGNNLHIQVHSNPTAIGVMATQGQELKNQLVSMGFTDVQMQFNMNQQQQQQSRHAFGRNGGYGEGEEPAEFYESLDLIIPQYV